MPRLFRAIAALAPALACGAGGGPPPGLYQIDREFTLRGGTGPAASVQYVKSTDGSTGDSTITRRAAVDGRSAVERLPGNGPVRSCVRPGVPPAWVDAQACRTGKATVPGSGREIDLQCSTGRQDAQWLRVDERTWQHRYAVPVSVASAGHVPAATAAAMAPAIAALEERSRNAPPEQAEMARRQLSALRGGGAAGGAPTATVVERWTRVGDACPKAP